MWCILCKEEFLNAELFKCHILDKHRPTSYFYKDGEVSTDDSDSADDDKCKYKNKSENINLGRNCEFNSKLYSEDPKSCTESFDLSKVKIENDTEDCPNSVFNETETKSSAVIPESSSALRRSIRLRRKSTNTKNYYENSDEDTNENSMSPVKKRQVINPLIAQVLDPSHQFINTPINALNYDALLQKGEGFALTKENIFAWFMKYQEINEKIKYPLPNSIYEKTRQLRTCIINHYCQPSQEKSEENKLFLDIYEILEKMILKHHSSVNETL